MLSGCESERVGGRRTTAKSCHAPRCSFSSVRTSIDQNPTQEHPDASFRGCDKTHRPAQRESRQIPSSSNRCSLPRPLSQFASVVTTPCLHHLSRRVCGLTIRPSRVWEASERVGSSGSGDSARRRYSSPLRWLEGRVSRTLMLLYRVGTARSRLSSTEPRGSTSMLGVHGTAGASTFWILLLGASRCLHQEESGFFCCSAGGWSSTPDHDGTVQTHPRLFTCFFSLHDC